MNKYGDAALRSVQLYKLHYDPLLAWELATIEIFGESTSQQKVCPKSTFLGLCQNGLIRGIKEGNYTSSKENTEYALKAVEFLLQNWNYISPIELWKEIQPSDISHNSQMDVVLALWVS